MLGTSFTTLDGMLAAGKDHHVCMLEVGVSGGQVNVRSGDY